MKMPKPESTIDNDVDTHHADDGVVTDPATSKLKHSHQMKKKLSSSGALSKKGSTSILIPLLSGFLSEANNIASDISTLSNAQGKISLSTMTGSTGFHFTDAALAAIDFFRIPIIYLGALIVGEKPPITLSKNLRWAYSGVLLGTTIAALAIPAAAPPIALVAASLTLGFSLYTMAKTLYYRYKAPKELKKITATIDAETEELNQLHLKTMALEEQLDVIGDNNSEQKIALEQEMKATADAFNELFEKRQEHYETQSQYQAIIEKHNTEAVLDKGVAIAVSALALAGLTLGLFFPPLGGGILAASALIGVVYCIAKISHSPIKHLMTKLFGKHDAPEDIVTSHEEQGLSPNHTDGLSNSSKATTAPDDHMQSTISTPLHEQTSATPAPVSGSTVMLMQKLYGIEGATAALNQQIAENKSTEKIQLTLAKVVEHHHLVGVLEFFSKVPSYVHTDNGTMTIEDLKQFLYNFDELQPSLILLKQAIAEVKAGNIILSEHDKNELLTCQPLVEFLRSEQIDLRVLTPVLLKDTSTTAAATTTTTTTKTEPDERQRL